MTDFDMSFMPNVGVVVRMVDGRTAAVSSVSPLGDRDRVVFPDGHEEATDAWQIAEVLVDLRGRLRRRPAKASDALAALLAYTGWVP